MPYNSMLDHEARGTAVNDRRSFLKLGGSAGAVVALGGMNSALASFPLQTTSNNITIDFSDVDLGVLNYAYLLEQLEAAFYTQVVSTPYAGITADERLFLTDLRDHEIIHREFFRAALGSNAIPTVQFDFSEVDFTSRDSVLTTSQNFEDLGVAAYNGAGQLLTNPTFLTLAGKIVSVEARHAATIRELRIPRIGYFAPDAADPAKDPLAVLTAASPFIRERVLTTNLPQITAV